MNLANEVQQNMPLGEFQIWIDLINAGFDTYLVGGAVRDIVLGRIPADWDFATSATYKEVAEVFKSDRFDVNYFGSTFGVTMVNGVEVATFRSDEYFGSGDKNLSVTFVQTIEEDLGRRDFTFNAMAITIHGNLIDPFGGVNDLNVDTGRRPRIRFVGDPERRMSDDPARILRAFRFATTLGGVLTGDTFSAISNNLHLVELIAPERIRKEVMRVLETADQPSYFWTQMKSTGVLDIIFPEFVKSVDHDHGQYHNEDVWTHSLIVGDAVSKDYPLLRLAALLHDVGKPRSYDPVERSFHQHHTHSADIVREWMNTLKFSGDDIRYVVNLVLVHMDGTRGMTAKARRRLKNKLGRYNLQWRDYVRLRIADRTGNLSRNNFTISQIRDYVEMFIIEEIIPVTVNHLALSGGELIKRFSLTHGPIVGILQRYLLGYVLDNGEEFNTENYLTTLSDEFLTNIK